MVNAQKQQQLYALGHWSNSEFVYHGIIGNRRHARGKNHVLHPAVEDIFHVCLKHKLEDLVAYENIYVADCTQSVI